MIIGTNSQGRVLLVLEGGAVENMPKDFNGVKITAHELTKEQAEALAALPADRAGALFDGKVFAVVPPDAAAVKLRLESAVQRHLDAAASARGYDSILSACSYATSAHQVFGAEGRAFRDWRDAVWAHCYEQLAAVEAGQPIPTEAELLAALPLPTLP